MGYGVISEVATGFPGYDSVFPDTNGLVAEILKDNGYKDGGVRKMASAAGLRNQCSRTLQWPTGVGFEHYYGFLGGDANQWSPPIIDGTRPIEKPARDKNYNFTIDMTNQGD